VKNQKQEKTIKKKNKQNTKIIKEQSKI